MFGNDRALPCLACGVALPAVLPLACEACGAPLVCPPGRELPEQVRAVVLRRHLARYFAPHNGPQLGWQIMLANAYRGQTVTTTDTGGAVRRVFVPHAAGPNAAYAAALVDAKLFTVPTAAAVG
jgi:hypothetical protein